MQTLDVPVTVRAYNTLLDVSSTSPRRLLDVFMKSGKWGEAAPSFGFFFFFFFVC
jgi:hypothetical protein